MKSSGQKASWTVDLGSPHLVSGLITQGPPESLHPPDYMRYISLTVLLSQDNKKWKVSGLIIELGLIQILTQVCYLNFHVLL